MCLRRLWLLLALLFTAVPAGAAEHPSLAQARALYNAADYDGAIDAATAALGDPASVNPATLVTGRAYLERFRIRLDSADLERARTAFSMVRPASLTPRDYLDLLVGLGQALYLDEDFGAAAELFDVALSRRSSLGERDALALLDWWATAMDREAWRFPPERRMGLLDSVRTRMEEEVRRDPGSPPANYWLAASARAAGDLDRAWHASVAAWVRAPLRPETAAVLRADIDRFVTEALVPERARTRPEQEVRAAMAALLSDWNTLKSQWQ
jgi:tetratricopeptide (TPR) repeat protein